MQDDEVRRVLKLPLAERTDTDCARVCLWIESHKKILLATARRMVPDRDLAEEALHEVYVKLLKKRFDGYKPEYPNPLPWLQAIIRNEVRMELRRRARARANSTPIDDAQLRLANAKHPLEGHRLMDLLTPEIQAIARRNWEIFIECVREVPSKHGPIIQALLAGTPVAEVAAQFGLKEDTVTKRKHRWLKKVTTRFVMITGGDGF